MGKEKVIKMIEESIKDKNTPYGSVEIENNGVVENKMVIYYPFYKETDEDFKEFKKLSTDEKNTKVVELIHKALKSKYSSLKSRAKIKYVNFEKFKHYLNQVLKEDAQNLNENDYILAYTNGLYHQKDIYGNPVKKIWNLISANEDKDKVINLEEVKEFQIELSFEKFANLILKQRCEYCEITLEDIYSLGENKSLFAKNARGYTMEIDQKNPNGGYTEDNCVTACYWCNNAKTDEFSCEEFKRIAEGFKVVWENRLADIKEK